MRGWEPIEEGFKENVQDRKFQLAVSNAVSNETGKYRTGKFDQPITDAAKGLVGLSPSDPMAPLKPLEMEDV